MGIDLISVTFVYYQLLNASRDALVNFQSSFAGLEADLGLLGDARSLLDAAVISLQKEVRTHSAYHI